MWPTPSDGGRTSATRKLRTTQMLFDGIIVCVVLFLVVSTDGYVLHSKTGILRFDASLGPSLSSSSSDGRHYEIDGHRTPNWIRRRAIVDLRAGVVQVKVRMKPRSKHVVFLPIYIASTSSKTVDGTVDYVSMPFLMVLPPKDNRTASTFNQQLEEELSSLRSIVSVVIEPSMANGTSDGRLFCVSRNRPLVTLKDLVPRSFNHCRVSYEEPSNRAFAVESVGGHLVSRYDYCFEDSDYGQLVVQLKLHCDSFKVRTHVLNVVFHRPGVDKFDNRVLRNHAISRSRRETLDRVGSVNLPHFDRPLYMASVPEEREKGDVVMTVTAVDPKGHALNYSMLAVLDARSQNMFRMEAATGAVLTTTKLDREFMDVHYFRVTAVDAMDHGRSATATLQIDVADVNDHAPTFEQNLYETSMREGASVGSTVVTVRATDRDTGDNARIAYELVQDPEGTNGGSDTFRVDSQTGMLTTRRQLDRETISSYELTIRATDQGTAAQRKTATTTIKVTVLDDNDNYPQFSQRTYAVEVPEDVNWTANPVIVHVSATDKDAGANGALRYTLVSGNTQGRFLLDGLTGRLSVAGPLDYEELRNYRLAVRAQDGGSPSRSNTTHVLVNVLDVNDNAPRFYADNYHETVIENVPIATSVLRVQAYDADDGVNAQVKYAIRGLATDAPFAVGQDDGWITTIRDVDREEAPSYIFTVEATDGGKPSLSATASVTLIIQDVNDNDPKFESETYEAVISEDDPPGTSVLSVVAHDPDENQRLVYHITDGNNRGRFSIAAQGGKGVISVAQPLDYRQEKVFVLMVTATDHGLRSDTTTVNINVSDANTHRPIFEQAPYSTSVLEDVPVGTTVLVVSASDGDVGENARITYTLGNEQEDDSDFTIDSSSGAIVTSKLLDRERQAGYIISVTAKDNGTPQLSDTTDVEITVADVNDNPPQFEKDAYHTTVTEEAPIGTSVLIIKATDEDQGFNGRVRYTLANNDGDFSLDPTSGIIRTARLLDRETVAKHTLEAVAIDRGTPELSTTVQITVDIEDVNDNPPRFSAEKLQLYVAENSPIGTMVGMIKATDPDEGPNAVVTYSIAGGPDAQAFSLSTRGDLAEIILRVEVDYESPKKKFDLILRAASPPLRSDVPVEVFVRDVNDNAPILKDFKIVFNNYPRHFPKGPIGQVPAFDADVSDNLTYKFISGNNAQLLRLDSNTGQITLNPSLDTNVPLKATLQVSVTDGVNEVSAECQLSVLMVTDTMLFNSVSLRLGSVSLEEFLSPLMTLFIEGLAAVVPCPKENVLLFDVHEEDLDVLDGNSNTTDDLASLERQNRVLKLSFSVKKLGEQFGVVQETYFPSQYLMERIYPERALLARITTLHVLPFADDLCVQEPCLDFERCLSVQKFGNASSYFLASDTILFRAIHPVDTFACRCPVGFAGQKEHYLCDVEVDLCYSNPCQNNGTCIRNEGGYNCVCREGFTGNDCETDVRQGTCVPGVCRGNSRCVNFIQGGITCENCTIRSGNDDLTPFCELRTRSFDRGSFLTFPSLQQRHRFTIRLQFATVQANGILLYNGRYNDQHDFVALELVDGHIRFSFSLGSKTTRVEAKNASTDGKGRLDDGQWHNVTVEYVNRVSMPLRHCLRVTSGQPIPTKDLLRWSLLATEVAVRRFQVFNLIESFQTATVWLDSCDKQISLQFGERLGNYFCANHTIQELEFRCADATATCHRFLDLTGPLQVGGVPSLPSTFQVTYKDFAGCIRDLRIDNKLIDMNSYVADNGTSEGCSAKRKFCFSSPCRNGGTCEEHWKTYNCHCPTGYGGRDCERGIDPPRNFQGDGYIVFNPSLRPIQVQWFNSLSLRTRLSRGLLLSIHLGSKSSGGGVAYLDVVDGLLRYTYNGIQVILNGTRVDDGQWHHAEVKWMGSSIWMSLDYGRFEVIGHMNTTVQGLYAGKVTAGGLESSEAKGTSAPNFKGCIQDVRIGSDPNSWVRPSSENNVSETCPTVDHCISSPCGNSSQCVSHWDRRICVCQKGYYGPRCLGACQLNPCLNNGTCVRDDESRNGYGCQCTSQYRGDHCEHVADGPCPSGWWGKPSCGPCRCPVHHGYDPNCEQTNGTCHCRADHYRPQGADKCFSCDCYRIGSFATSCNVDTGQCRCRSGVVGRRCDSCPHSLAEVTLRGCEVIYDACPRSFADNIWWERTYFGESTIQNCPTGWKGKSSRRCTVDDGWGTPDLFNCTLVGLTTANTLLSDLVDGTVILDSDLIVQISKELHSVANTSSLPGRLFGNDVLIMSQLLLHVLTHEKNQSGLNLSHRQDRDFLQNLLEVISYLLDPSHQPHWERMRHMGFKGPEALVLALDEYARTLVQNRGDTFTPPFEIVTPNLVFGVDTVTPADIRAYNDSGSIRGAGGQVSVILPKYNNYPARQSNFDRRSRFLLPVSALIHQTVTTVVRRKRLGSTTSTTTTAKVTSSSPSSLPFTSTLMTAYRKRPDSSYVWTSLSQSPSDVAAVAYTFYLTAGSMLPLRFATDVRQRWGTPLILKSPILSLNLQAFNGTYGTSRRLPQPLRLKFVIQTPSSHTDPQCVHWKTTRAGGHIGGHWSTEGCTVQWSRLKNSNRTIINCTCWHLSTYGVLMDVVDEDRIPEASVAEDVVMVVGLSVAMVALFLSLIVFCLLRGLQTNSNTIHKNLAVCALLVFAMFMMALRLRRTLVHKPFPCKLTAIFLHYLYLCKFSWMLVEGLHLYRMMTEMRDINHGQMRFYYSVGYGAPAVVVGLAVGVKADEYGNPIFCWLSVYGSAVWSLFGPICFVVMLNLIIFVLAIHASVRMKENVEDFGNLKTLLWLGIVLLPLLGATWVSAVMAVNENDPILYYLFAFFAAAQGIYIFLGYCVLNEKVRQHIHKSWLRCSGKKSSQHANSGTNTAAIVSRSALAYHNTNSFDILHRNIGISTSSTTSRSTCKTSGSPYRPQTATSTSTPPSHYTSDIGGYRRNLRQRGDRIRHVGNYNYGIAGTRQTRNQVEDPNTGEVYHKRSGDSDTESDLSLDHASLDLASSHSSDEEEVNGKQPRVNNTSTNNYAPNILSSENTNGQSYNIPANVYSTRWSSRGPSSLPPFVPRLHMNEASPCDDDVDRASVVTASDNELNPINEVSLTEAVFSRFSPPLIDADDDVSSPEQLPAPDGGFGSRESSTPTSPRPSALLLAERRMVVPSMTTASANSESDESNDENK